MSTIHAINRGKGRKQQGLTLLEGLVWLALFGIVIAGVAMFINRSFNSNDMKDEQTALTSVMTSLPEIKSSSGYGTSGTNLVPQLIAMDAIPAQWSVQSGVPYNAWGGTVSITSNGPTVTITATQIPKDACVKMAPRLSKGSNFQTTKIGSNTAITGEVTSAQATSQCGASNTIAWTTRS